MASQLLDVPIDNVEDNSADDHSHQGKPRLSRLTTLSESVQPADVGKAYEHRNHSSIRVTQEDGTLTYMPIWGTTIETMSQFSLGLSLYFAMLKYFTIAFFIIGCMSIWPFIENLKGDYFDSDETNQFYDRWSLANQYGSAYWDQSESEAEDDIDEIDANQLRMTMADMSYTIVFLGFIIFFIVKTQLLAKKTAQENITAANYCLKVKGLPEAGLKAEEVKKHFSNFGEVVDVSLARIYDGLLDLYGSHFELSMNLSNERVLAQKRGDPESRKIRMMERKLEMLNDKIKRREAQIVRTHDELPVIYAFVVFNSADDSNRCYSVYKNSKKCCQFASSQSQELQFRGHHPLSVSRATEPDNILWENLEINSCYRCMRKFLVAIITCCVMVSSVALLYYMKTVEDDIPTREECVNDYNVSRSLSLSEAKDQLSSSKEKICFCQSQKYSDFVDDSDLRDYCDNYIKKSAKVVGIKFATSLGVVIINFILKVVLVRLSRFERPSTKGREQVKVMLKVFIAIFINTAVVNLMVTSDLQELWFVKYLPFHKYLFNDEFDDFTRYWYLKSGSMFVTTMLISIVSPHCVNLVVFYPIGLVKRSCKWMNYTTQYDLNQAFTTIEFDIATRTSSILNIIFTCFMYSGGMPFLNMICAASLFTIYWVDKFLVLRHYFKPSNFGPELAERVASLLPFAVILHCGFSLWMLSASEVFPTGYKVRDGYVEPDTNTFKERIYRTSGIVNIILIVVALTLVVFNAGIVSIYERIKKRKHIAVSPTDRTSPHNTYLEEYEKLASKGLASYDIKLNMKYAPLILTLDRLALKNRKNKEESMSEADSHEVMTGNKGQNHNQE